MARNTPGKGRIVSGSVDLQHYMVLYLDVLGQRERLRQLKMPTTPEERTEVVNILRDTLRVVETLRGSFEDFFEKYSGESAWVTALPQGIRRRMRQARRTVSSYRGFSDSYIITVPLNAEYENCTTMNGVRSALVAACGLPLYLMALGYPLRGGVDVGVCVRLKNGEVYGAALERAYTLEGSVAEYPRIAVGRTLPEYLEWVSAQNPSTQFGEIAVHSARLCRRLIIKDADGSLMLDFLGSAFREAVDDQIDRDLLRQAHDFARRQYAEYQNNGNCRLSSRYKRLLTYFDSRIDLWNM